MVTQNYWQKVQVAWISIFAPLGVRCELCISALNLCGQLSSLRLRETLSQALRDETRRGLTLFPLPGDTEKLGAVFRLSSASRATVTIDSYQVFHVPLIFSAIQSISAVPAVESWLLEETQRSRGRRGEGSKSRHDLKLRTKKLHSIKQYVPTGQREIISSRRATR